MFVFLDKIRQHLEGKFIYSLSTICRKLHWLCGINWLDLNLSILWRFYGKKWKERLEGLLAKTKRNKSWKNFRQYNYGIAFLSLLQEIPAKIIQNIVSLYLSPEKESKLPRGLASDLTTLGTASQSPLPSSRSFFLLNYMYNVVKNAEKHCV